MKTQFGSAIHDALFKSRFADKMKFTIMWENQARGQAGVADETDLMTNLLPFWMENYFKHPSYLKVDNKPVLFIYRPEFLVEDLGGVENVAQGLRADAAGVPGRRLRRPVSPRRVPRARPEAPEAHEAARPRLHVRLLLVRAEQSHAGDRPSHAQMDYIRKTQELGILPQVVTVSQAWSGWHDEGSIWKIPPRRVRGRCCGRPRTSSPRFRPANSAASMLLLDNWNEWGEGHYIAPYREYGFGYLDAVRKVFSDAPEPHVGPDSRGHRPGPLRHGLSPPAVSPEVARAPRRGPARSRGITRPKPAAFQPGPGSLLSTAKNSDSILCSASGLPCLKSLNGLKNLKVFTHRNGRKTRAIGLNSR